MRYIAIDYGTKKVGIAVSNEDGTMAFPREVVLRDDNLFSHVRALTREYDAEVVLGDSRDFKGNENPVASDIKQFGDRLQADGVRIHFEPELYTSKEAERIQGKTAMTDASAAAVMLNSFLTRKK